MRNITPTQIREIAKFTESFTNKAFRYAGVGGDIGHGARYFEGTTQQVWLGNEGGRSLYAAYMIGFALGWARKSGQSIPAEMRELMQVVQCSYAKRYEGNARDTELEGRSVAEGRWEARNVLQVTNKAGVTFNVVLRSTDHMGPAELGFWVVEVFDTRYDHTEYGQFAGSAYVADLLTWANAGLLWSGWALNGGVDNWQLSVDNVNEVRVWLERAIAETDH
jgi:hypothetical protein